MADLTTENEPEEIDVTELIERIEKLEKENIGFKEKIEALESRTTVGLNRVQDVEESLDALVDKIGG